MNNKIYILKILKEKLKNKDLLPKIRKINYLQ